MTLRLAGLGLAFCLLASSAWAAPDPVVRMSVAVCDPNNPANCQVPTGGPSGVTAQTVTVSGSPAATGWLPVLAGRPYDIFFKLANFTGTCQQEVSPDNGTTAYITTVTAAGSTTVMQQWSFSGATVNQREQGEEFEAGMNVRTNCTATSGGTAVVKDAQ